LTSRKDAGFDFGKKAEHLSGKLLVLVYVMGEETEALDLI
jgi:hypothetical protein